MSVQSLTNATIDIQSKTPNVSAIGGVTSSWSTIQSAVPVKITPLDAESVMAFSRQDWKATDAIIFSSDFGLLPNVNRLVADGQQFIVRGVKHFKGGTLEHWKVIAERAPL